MTYEVPAQDLSVDLTRMPTAPKSGFRICQVRATGEAPLPGVALPPSGAAKPAAGAGCPFH